MSVKKATTPALQQSPRSNGHTSSVSKIRDVDGRRDLLGIEQLPKRTIEALIERSNEFFSELSKTTRFKKRNSLEGRTIGNLFFENSTRTRTSFELAEKRLGGDFISLSPAVSSLTKGESLLDTVRVLEAMKLDAIVVRHNAGGVPQFLADRLPSHVHVINAGDGAHEHPTQALLDAASLIEQLGDLAGKKIVIVGDIRHSRVARSNIWLLKKLGAQLTLVGPETLMPRAMAEVFDVEVLSTFGHVLRDADAIIALRIQQERQASGLLPSVEEYHEMYGITYERLIGTTALVLHPGPINLGVELDNDVAYGPRSLVLRQVKRGVAIRMAVLEWLFDENL